MSEATEPTLQHDTGNWSIEEEQWLERVIPRDVDRACMTTVEPALRRLHLLAKLGQNWDSYGADPIADAAVTAAARLLTDAARQLRDLDGAIRPVIVAPIADGGVLIEWDGRAAEIEVEIGADGDISYLLIERSGDQELFSEGSDISVIEALDLVRSVVTSSPTSA